MKVLCLRTAQGVRHNEMQSSSNFKITKNVQRTLFIKFTMQVFRKFKAIVPFQMTKAKYVFLTVERIESYSCKTLLKETPGRAVKKANLTVIKFRTTEKASHKKVYDS